MQKLVASVVLQNAEKNALKPFGDKEYHYFILNDVLPGDLVVLETLSGFRLGKVSKVFSAIEPNMASKFIVQKIDLESYRNQVIQMEELNKLQAQLHLELSKASEDEYYKSLLTSDNEKVRELAQKILDNQ